jgi:hypothetical protein
MHGELLVRERELLGTARQHQGITILWNLEFHKIQLSSDLVALVFDPFFHACST